MRSTISALACVALAAFTAGCASPGEIAVAARRQDQAASIDAARGDYAAAAAHRAAADRQRAKAVRRSGWWYGAPAYVY